MTRIKRRLFMTLKKEFVILNTTQEPSKHSCSSKAAFRKHFVGLIQGKVEGFKELYDAKQVWTEVTGLTARTLDRYRVGKSYPTGDNILQCFKFILETQDDDETLKKMPAYVEDVYKSQIRKPKSKKMADISGLLKSPIHYKIFLATMNQNYINKDDFIRDWGRKEVEPAFEEMNANLLIEHVEGGFYQRGSLNTSFGALDNYNLFKGLINNEITPEELYADDPGTALAFDCLNLNEESLEELYDLIEKFRQTIYELEKNGSGKNVVHVGIASKKSENGVQQ
jgi:hypothetical protein